MPEFLQYGFMHRAFAAGVVTALICPAIGVFLIPRRLSLIADTLAHVALAGVALGLVLGISPVLGALVVALEQWVKHNTAPPETSVPKIADGTLVEPNDLKLPKVPGLTYEALYNGSGDRDFGPRVKNNAGVIDLLIPVTRATHKVMVPQVDNIGNDIAGIRHPYVEAPVATLLGWNTRTKAFGGPDLCDLLGSTIALPRTKAEAEAAGDPRPSLAELYGTHEIYVQKVIQAARKLESLRLMLPEDVNMLTAEAEASNVLR